MTVSLAVMMQHKITEQRDEIERLTAERDMWKTNDDLARRANQIWSDQADVKIARIAKLEAVAQAVVDTIQVCQYETRLQTMAKEALK